MVLGKHRLIAHPDTPPKSIASVEVQLFQTDEDDVLFEFTVENAGDLIVPLLALPSRTDGLWSSTCFELFVRKPNDQSYWEYNFSPSGQWAAYHFNSYRDGRKEFLLGVPPMIEVHGSEPGDAQGSNLKLDVDVDLGGIPRGIIEIALCAVLEERDGTKSYWALAHPPGKPDFHHPDCFQLRLGAPDAA